MQSEVVYDVDKELFEVVKKACIDCMEKPTVETVAKLSGVISQCDASVVIPIHKYLMFPLQQILSNAAKQEKQ